MTGAEIYYGEDSLVTMTGVEIYYLLRSIATLLSRHCFSAIFYLVEIFYPPLSFEGGSPSLSSAT